MLQPGIAVNRRTFVKAAAAGLWANVAPARAARSASDQVVVGVMGVQRGSSLAASFAATPNVEVKYLCDVDSRRLTKAQKKLASVGISAEGTDDFRRLLDDPDVDALVCAAPNHWHGPATLLACAAGKHVYVEKPCSHNPQEGEWMIEAARSHHRLVQVGTQRRSGPKVREAIQRLHEGLIGRVCTAQCWYSNTRRSIGTGKVIEPPGELNYELWQGPAPRLPYYSNRVHYNWHWFWHYGNGELGNNGVHTLDLCRWGLGVELPERVVSSGGRYHFEDDQQTPDTHTVCYEFDDRKSIVWTGHSCNGHAQGFVCFYGEQGSLAIDSGGGYKVFDKQNVLVEEQTGTAGQNEHVANFIEAIRQENASTLHAEIVNGHRSTLLCHLGNIAHRTSSILRCNPATGKIHDHPEAMSHWGRSYAPGWGPIV